MYVLSLVHCTTVASEGDRLGGRLGDAVLWRGFTEEYHAVLNHTTSELIKVDTRVSRGGRGISQEHLERVLEYTGLSMSKDHIVNTSIDGDGDKGETCAEPPVEFEFSIKQRCKIRG
jgi:hypothetical protein